MVPTVEGWRGWGGGSTPGHCSFGVALVGTENQEQDLPFFHQLYNSKLSTSHPGVCIKDIPTHYHQAWLARGPSQLSTCLPVSPSGNGGISLKIPP